MISKVMTFCRQCHKQLEFHKVFANRLGMCPSCDHIQAIPQQNDVKKELVHPIQSQTQGKRCPNCFEFNEEKITHCAYCNEFIGAIDTMAICPSCKKQQAHAEYCNDCGADMHTGLIKGRL